MKEKLTPQEKKRQSYEKDHRTHTGESPRGMRKTWAKRKARINRKYRRKAHAALQQVVSPQRIDVVREGDDATTRELVRRGLTRDKNHKWGVSNLRETLQKRAESRKRAVEWKASRLAAAIQEFKDRVTKLEQRPELFDEREISRLMSVTRSTELRAFFQGDPSWANRLERRVAEVQKQRRKAAGEARIKEEEKRKWRSPALRLPSNTNTEGRNR